MGILSSIRIILSRTNGDRKLTDIEMPRYSPNGSQDLPAPPYEVAVAKTDIDHIHDGNSIESFDGGIEASISDSASLRCLNESDCGLNRSRSHIVPMPTVVLNSQESVPPLTHQREIRTAVTSGILKTVLKSTIKAGLVDTTQELVLRGTHTLATDTVDAGVVEKLSSVCPSMRVLTLQSLNLITRNMRFSAHLRDLPNNLERLSLRDSRFDPREFFANTDDSKMGKLRVLDVGRAIFARGGGNHLTLPWLELKGLKELYLEGAPHVRSGAFLSRMLCGFPNLEVLDIEGTELQEEALLRIAAHAPNLRELFVGQTGLRDVSVRLLQENGFGFEYLETICLSQTDISGYGIGELIEVCPSLVSITATRSLISAQTVAALEAFRPQLKIERVEVTSIFSVFRDQGCDHFTMKYCERENMM